ncbi:MAG: tryptophan synthase subunit alpha [Planctomycetaceae bacterium]|nr:tryptophan synthase subunit alpha [Planctomycetaceae bacterium]|tara:strand:- start:883 stop:1710 length:828 start_codon:yes stop_codon:yes gene_type:complete
MSAVDTLFSGLRQQGEKAFIPFITAGDPNLKATSELLSALVAQGSHLCEIGIPYSDPIADGPVIQASYTRVLNSGIGLDEIFQMLKETAPSLNAPVVTMVSHAIIHRRGLANYVSAAKESHVAGLIVPDLPVEESADLAAVCKAEDISLIQLITPNTPADRVQRIIDATTGFIYYVSVVGITGERQTLPEEIIESVQSVRDKTDLPICIGFGISTPEHVRLLAPVADGIIVGSAIVRRYASSESISPRQDAGLDTETVRKVGEYVKTLTHALATC